MLPTWMIASEENLNMGVKKGDTSITPMLFASCFVVADSRPRVVFNFANEST
jgi:hypothetical protein